ncbi:MAG TPA: CDC27 family protein, partial [Xanthobacteraceae bacterium]|nr:CDC27 family protein [Xanthobacteraceae bacterium]
AEGLGQLRQAISIDPDVSLARALLGLISAFGAMLSLVPDGAAAERDAREEAEHAVALDPHAPDVLGFAGCALADVGYQARGHELLLRALELDPSNAQAHVAIGVVLTQADRFDDGIKHMQFGMRSSPRDFRLTFWAMILANALARAGRFEEALATAENASRRDASLYGARVVAARVLQKLNRSGEARSALDEARRIRPALNLDEIRRFFGPKTADDLTPLWG